MYILKGIYCGIKKGFDKLSKPFQAIYLSFSNILEISDANSR